MFSVTTPMLYSMYATTVSATITGVNTQMTTLIKIDGNNPLNNSISGAKKSVITSTERLAIGNNRVLSANA